MRINPPKHSTIPSLLMREPEQVAEMTTADVDVKDTTTVTTVGFDRGEKNPTTTGKSPDSDARPKFRKCKPETIQAKAAETPSGLRMREDVLANITDLHKGPRSEDGGLKSTKGTTETPFIIKPSETNQGGAGSKQLETAADTVSPCGGLTHRTEAGWKHCMERQGIARSELLSSRGTTESTQNTPGQRDDDPPNEDDHFYYFDGVLKRVQNNFYPFDKTQRRRQQRSHNNRKNDVPTEAKRGGSRVNFLSYIRHLTLRNKAK
ncbi:uncharacterized protein LOC124996300 [Mugil cephalus]|uniref:uncharacterized protein LOC124996300 n=1 Tax=Mugil cephalus TaxID=48193 RepID=UPI001FB7F053|nr:uncharacterized protein LOC124996300 [Mugil cephalus]